MHQKLHLAAPDGFADAQNGLLALLDVLHQLNGRRIALADVIAHFFGRALIAVQHLAVLGVEPKLRQTRRRSSE
jgi:hypothetical protein